MQGRRARRTRRPRRWTVIRPPTPPRRASRKRWFPGLGGAAMRVTEPLRSTRTRPSSSPATARSGRWGRLPPSGLGTGERVRTAGLPFTRSTVPCCTCAACTYSTGYRADGTCCAGIIRRAGPRTGPRRIRRPVTECNIAAGSPGVLPRARSAAWSGPSARPAR